MLKVRNYSKAGMLKTFSLASLLLCSTAAMAQSQKTGVIKDANGEPLVGVTVLEQGTSNGTVTNYNDLVECLVISLKDHVLSWSDVLCLVANVRDFEFGIGLSSLQCVASVGIGYGTV